MSNFLPLKAKLEFHDFKSIFTINLLDALSNLNFWLHNRIIIIISLSSVPCFSKMLNSLRIIITVKICFIAFYKYF